MAVKRYHIDIVPELGIIAENVKSIRQAAGLTQKQLSAKALVSPAIISGIENGTGNPSILTMLSLADALGVAGSDLLSARCDIDDSQ